MAKVMQLSFDVLMPDDIDPEPYLDVIDNYIESDLRRSCLGYGVENVTGQYESQGYLNTLVKKTI